MEPSLSENGFRRGRLEQITQMASGGMSEIFRAWQPALDRWVVIKKLKDELRIQPETVERFRREAKALASVLHQNIAHVYDFIESANESLILMEYIDGADVSNVVEKVGHLPSDVAASILLGVCKGVSYIHTHHLIHRDIKPSNIRLTTRGEVKLMDFGIVMDIENTGLTRPGHMVGSPSYLSPEQVLGDSISEKTDLFLLGICFYEMLTGIRPFKDEGTQTIFQRIREVKFVPVRIMKPSVPRQLERIAHRCLKKNPDERYGSVKEVITELEKFLGSHKSTHTEDILLKYLDTDALLVPSIPYQDLEKSSQQSNQASKWLKGLVLALVASSFFAAGFWVSRFDRSNVSTQNNWPAPRPMR